MAQYVIMVSCWFLAVGRGSGLSGLSSGDHGTTTLQPHSPGPPLSTSSSPILTVTSDQTSNQYALSNTSLSFYPLHVNATSSPLEVKGVTLGVASGTTPFAQLPINLPLLNQSYSTTFYKDVVLTKTTTGLQETERKLKKDFSNSSEILTMSRPDGFMTEETKEYLLNVPQKSQKELFIRRKHKGPYHAERVRKLSALLRGTDPPKLTNKTELNSTRDFVTGNKISRTKTQTFSGFLGMTSVRPGLSKPLQRPNLYLTTQQTNKTETFLKEHRIRKRPIMMGIPASSTVLHSPRTTSTLEPNPTPGTDNPPDSDEYYSSYAEYPDTPTGNNKSVYSEAAVLPDPDSAPRTEDLGSVAEAAEVEADVVLPDDSLADTDLHDHDLIDSVMYIYFGSSERDERGAGRQVLIVGAVISLVAQSLTLISVLRRLRSRPDEHASLILLNAELALTVGNLVFMLGVQATGSQRRCELVAIALHYLHLAACSWFLVNSVFSYSALQSQGRHRLRPWWVTAWCAPAVVVMLCMAFNRRGYETRSFCWVSVSRGMLYSFMAPVALLILLNTCFAVLGLRQISLSAKTDDADRKSMKISAILLPVYAVVWFLGVVALENSSSLVFPLLFVASSGFLNWFILACWLPEDMSLWRESDDDYDDDDDDLYEEVLKTHTDSQPLLEEPHIYVCGRRDVCELQMDPICTISS